MHRRINGKTYVLAQPPDHTIGHERHPRYAGDDFATLRWRLTADLAQMPETQLERVSHPIADAIEASMPRGLLLFFPR